MKDCFNYKISARTLLWLFCFKRWTNRVPALLTITQFLISFVSAQAIDRKLLVERHSVVNTRFDSLASLSVGNGRFAFTVDVTGLQSFSREYGNGVPLGTQSEWGWHSFPDTANYSFDETLQYFDVHGRNISYSVQSKEPLRKKNAVDWYRQNPHRLQLGNIGFELTKKDGSLAAITDIQNIRQTLNMWTGEIHSHFTIENIPVDVTTYSHQVQDAISVKVRSPLLKQGNIRIRLQFPYPTGNWSDAGISFYENNNQSSSVITKSDTSALIQQLIDTVSYFVALKCNRKSTFIEKSSSYFVISPTGGDNYEFSCRFAEKRSEATAVSFAVTSANSKEHWMKFWQSGAAVDFKGSSDPRAFELERRIILSQYITRIQCAGNYPPQETGLTYNSWYGRPHLEMHWWHAIHFSLWGRNELMEKSLNWYAKVSEKGRQIAKRQGYEGIRWQKMTDNKGNESPSSVGAFLIWQQPHIIYFSELCYRNTKSIKTLEKYKDLVFATADFMASYAYFDSVKQKYVLGPALIPAQESFKPDSTINPAYELVYWYWALKTAQQWRVRLHLPGDKKWNDVINRLSKLTDKDGKYLFTENAFDSYLNPRYKTDHPSVLGALGMLPKTDMVDSSVMYNTFNWIWDNWSWPDTWGWDFPMTAMTATRLGMPEKAIESLLMPVQTNTYLSNGHNYQDKRLTIYLPGNGGLLAAIAMMCAGYDGSKITNPGIPGNGKWKVKWEGLKRMP